MKKVFWIYVIWHIILLLFQFDVLLLPKGTAIVFGCVMVLNLFYISFIPFFRSVNSTRGTRSDLIYQNICISLIPSRFIVMALGVLGQETIYNVIFCELLFIPCYFIYMKYFVNRVSQKAIYEAMQNEYE